MRLMTALTSILLLTSCIYDAPGDRFYRTLWTSSEATFYTAGTNDGTDIGTDIVTEVSTAGDTDSDTDIATEASTAGSTDIGTDIATEVSTAGSTDIGTAAGITPHGLTLEFLCGGSVCVYSTGAVGSYGTYDTHGTTAYFTDLRLTYHNNGTPTVIIIEEAHRTDDLLLISWHYSGSATSYSTRMVRKSSYD